MYTVNLQYTHASILIVHVHIRELINCVYNMYILIRDYAILLIN